MYLDVVFIISSKGIKALKKIDKRRRLNYILGIDNDTSFTEHIVDIDDFSDTTEAFYDLLTAPDLYLSKESKAVIYEDDCFKIYCPTLTEIHKLDLAISNVDDISIAEISRYKVKPAYSAYEKMNSVKCLLHEAIHRKAGALLVVRKDRT